MPEDLIHTAMAPPGVSVLIPAYNEEHGVGHAVQQARTVLLEMGLQAEQYEIIVIDDGSSDGTATSAGTAGARVISHRHNSGYGASLKTGLRRARFETIVITDADGTYPISEVGSLLGLLEECDMAVGSRTGDDVHIPTVRRPAKWLLKITAEFLVNRPIPDLNSGLRAFRRSDALRFMNLYPAGFSFTTTITLAFLSNDLLVHYLPINYNPRTGKSKIRPIRDTKNLFMTVVRSILFFNPLRVCIPLGLLLILISLLIAVFIRDSDGRILDGTITILMVSALQIIIMGFLADILARLRK